MGKTGVIRGLGGSWLFAMSKRAGSLRAEKTLRGGTFRNRPPSPPKTSKDLETSRPARSTGAGRPRVFKEVPREADVRPPTENPRCEGMKAGSRVTSGILRVHETVGAWYV